MHQAIVVRTHAVHPDTVRIVALASAISLNAVLMLMVLRPLAPMLQHLATAPQTLTLQFLEPPPKAIPIAPPTPHIMRSG